MARYIEQNLSGNMKGIICRVFLRCERWHYLDFGSIPEVTASCCRRIVNEYESSIESTRPISSRLTITIILTLSLPRKCALASTKATGFCFTPSGSRARYTKTQPICHFCIAEWLLRGLAKSAFYSCCHLHLSGWIWYTRTHIHTESRREWTWFSGGEEQGW